MKGYEPEKLPRSILSANKVAAQLVISKESGEAAYRSGDKRKNHTPTGSIIDSKRSLLSGKKTSSSKGKMTNLTVISPSTRAKLQVSNSKPISPKSSRADNISPESKVDNQTPTEPVPLPAKND